MASTHARLSHSAVHEWFQGPVVSANSASKLRTIVQLMVMMLGLVPSWVVTRITGPGSTRVKARESGNGSIGIFLHPAGRIDDSV